MKKLIMLIGVMLMGVICCESPTEPKQDENVFIIELYSYTAGATTKPIGHKYYHLWITDGLKTIAEGYTDDNGRATIKVTDLNLKNEQYLLVFKIRYNDIFEFGKTHVYKGYF